MAVATPEAVVEILLPKTDTVATLLDPQVETANKEAYKDPVSQYLAGLNEEQAIESATRALSHFERNDYPSYSGPDLYATQVKESRR